MKKFNEDKDHIDFDKYYYLLLDQWESENDEILCNEDYVKFQIWALEQAYNKGIESK